MINLISILHCDYRSLTKTNILVSCITTKHVCRRSTRGRGCSIFVVIHILIWDIWPGVSWSLCFTCKKNNIVLSVRFLLTTGFTVPFNNRWTLKLKAQPTNVLFTTVNQMFGSLSQLPTTAEHMVIESLYTVQTKQCSAVVGSWEELPNIWLTVAKNA